MLWSLLWQDQAVVREISRPHGARLLTSFESRQYMPVIKATSTRTSKNNIQWWKILPSSDKEITPLKSSWSLGCNLRKRIVLQRRIVLVLLTAVDLRQTMCAAWPGNISLQSTSLPPKGFQRVPLVSITIFISSSLHFFFKYKLFEDLCHSQSRWFTTTYYVTKRKSPHCFDQRISRAFPGIWHTSFKTISGCPNWKREWIKINNTKQN